MMRQLLGQMALRLEGQTAFLFRLARAWDRRGCPGKRLGAPVYAGGQVCHL
jgi:putative acyl-CoA dehydrogenase